MAKYGSDKVAFLLIDGYSILGSVTEITDEKEALYEETTPLGGDWEKKEYVGLKNGKIEQNGFFDDESNGVNDALAGQSGVNRVVSYGFEDNLIGRKCINWSGALQVKYGRAASRGTLHKAKASYENSGEIDEGIILNPLMEVEGDGEMSEHDNSAQTTDGAVFYLHITSLTLDGATNVIVSIEDSADGESWATLQSFTAVTAAPAVERKVKTGTIRRYLRVARAFTNVQAGSKLTLMVSAKRY